MGGIDNPHTRMAGKNHIHTQLLFRLLNCQPDDIGKKYAPLNRPNSNSNWR